ncbi:IPT/TIG domain-containing protein, partial [bacterium]|nr:IPT/TIG domain-containing protein [bacterium]
ASGSFTTTFTVDTQKYGATIISAKGASSTTATASTTFFILHDVISISPTLGTVGDTITVAGTGYGSNGTFTIDFGINANIQQATASTNGSFSCTFTVPIHVYGTETVTTTYDGGAGFSTATFFVNPNITSIMPTSGTVGASITISGNGYNPNVGTIKILLGNNLRKTGITCISDGTFNSNFIIDAQPYGTTSVTAVHSNSSYSYINAQGTITIGARIYDVSPSNGTVGSTITISGNGFAANSPGSITFGPNNSFRGTFPDNTSGSGTFTNITFTVDAQAFGTTTVVATTGDAIGTGSFKILANIKPLSPTIGTVGSWVTINGFGFSSGATSITFGGTSMPSTNTTTNGTFTISFTVPPTPGTTAIVQATKGESTGTDTYTIIPRIYSVAPSQGSIGTLITIKGDGLGNENVTINFGAVFASQTTASAEGTFTCVFTAPAQAYGTTSIVAIGQTTATQTTGSYVGTFSVQPYIYEITPTTGTIGTLITVNGSGFSVNMTAGTVTVGVEDRGTFSTSQAGTFTSTFTVDSHVYGSNTVTATDENSVSYARVEGFIMKPLISVLPISGYVGDTITVSGEGFGSSEVVVVHFGEVKTIATPSAGVNGAFSVSFTVAEQPATITITANGTATGAATNTPFYVTSKIVGISPNSGTIGTVVEVKGQGYAAGETLWADFGSSLSLPMTPSTATVTGSFTASFVTVSQPYGIRTITVKQGGTVGRQASGTFSVEAVVTMITPSRGTVGALVTVEGTGFGPVGTITLGLDTNTRATFTTIATNGTFSKTFTVDAQVYGTKTITVFHAGLTQVKTGSFTIMPSIAVNPTEGTVGATVGISGAGYGGGESVEMVLGNTATRTTYNASPNGTFSTSFTVDVQPQRIENGSTTVTGFGTFIGTAATTGLYLRINITDFNPVQGTVGSNVTIKGNGAADGCEVALMFGEAKDAMSIPTTNGTFEYTYVVDTQYAGTKTVVVIDEYGGGTQDRATKTYKILPNLWIVTPTSGTVGTIITVEGAGYGITETVSVLFENAIRTTATTSDDGTFTANFTASWVPYGNSEIKGTSASGVGPPTSEAKVYFFVLPKVLGVAPASGTVGTSVTVWGNGFAGAGARVRINFGTTDSIVTVNPDTTYGSFTAVFAATIQPATTTITAFRIDTGDNSAGGTSTDIFVIKGRITDVTPQIGTIGSSITIKGDGWAADEQIWIGFGKTVSRALITSLYNTSAGTFSYLFTVDNQPAGITSITATGVVSQAVWGTKTFQIMGRVEVSPKSGTVGSWVMVTGSGFTSTDSVTIHFGKTSTITQITSDTAGGFTVSLTVDTQSFGSTTVRATGISSGEAERDYFTIIGEIIEVMPGSGLIGISVTVKGNGFGASEQVRIDFGGHVNIVQATASDVGTFSAIFTVDAQGYGAKEIKATGQTTSTIGTDTFTIGARITLVTPSEGTVGSQVLVEGDGFGSSVEVSILFGDAGTVTTITSSTAGTFSCTFTARSQSYGLIAITAKDTLGAQGTTSSYTICPSITSILPAQGTIGQSIAINGEGFKYNETIDISVSGSVVVKSCSVNSLGQMTGTFTVGTQTGGTKTVLADGQLSTSATYTFKMIPDIYVVNPGSAIVGTQIRIRGNGYTGTNTPISIDFGTTPKIGTLAAGYAETTDGQGTFEYYFNVNTQPYGTTTIKAYEDLTGQTAEKILVILPKITQITPQSGTVGLIISVSGTGYAVGSTKVFLGTNPDPRKSFTVVSNGSFDATFTIDEQPYGSKTVTVKSSNPSLSYITDTGSIFITANIVSITPSSGTIGTSVTMQGSGFEAGQNIKLDVGSSTTNPATQTTAGGTFTVVFAVPTNEGATTTVLATGAVATASTIFMVQGRITSVNPTQGTVGSSVTISGDGFKKSETIKVEFGTGRSFTTSINEYGEFVNVVFTVDTQVYGTTEIRVTGQASGLIASTSTYKILSDLVATPGSGTVGTTINLLGTGFGTLEPIWIDFGTIVTKVTTNGASSAGLFTTSFTIDTQPYGLTTVRARCGAGTPDKIIQVQINPNIISVTPSSGSVGTSVTVYGNGYGISEDVRIKFGTNPTIATVSGNAYGSFTATFSVDVQAAGTTTIIAYKQDLIASSEIAFVITANSQLVVTPTIGTVGTSITITGSGFGTNEWIKVDFGTDIPYAPALSQASDAGTFSKAFNVNDQKRGNTLITATGSSTAQAVTGYFFVKPDIIGFTPTIGTVGTIVTVWGSGCANPDTLGIDFGGTTDIVTVATTPYGSFTATFTVDTQVYGTTTATVSTNEIKDEPNTKEDLTKTFFIQQAWVTFTPNTGTVGTFVTVAGNGFAGGEGIVVSFGTNPTITTTNAATNGSFTAIFTVDVQVSGADTLVMAKGTTTLVYITDNFTILPQIVSSNPTQGTVGTVITIVANGYGSESVKITYGEGTYAGSMTVNTSQYGSFTTYFTVNTQSYGTKTVSVYGQTTAQTSTSIFKIIPQVTITPTTGSVGTLVTINGNGFGDPEQATAVLGITSVATPTTNLQGVICSGNTFAIDEQPYGDTPGTVTGMASQYSVNFPGFPDQGFKILANLTQVQPTEGSVGTRITVYGNGFKKLTEVNIKFGGTDNIVMPFLANGYGTFTTTFTVNTQAYGTTTVTGMQSGYDRAAKTVKILPAIISVNPSSGPVGLMVTIIGNGYPANNNLRIEFGSQGSIANTMSDAISGSFTVSFAVNTQPAGTTTIRVWDSGGTIGTASTFKIGGRLTRISPNTGSVGTVVTLEGDGFGSPDGLRVDFGDGTGWGIQTLSITGGTFATTFTVNTQMFGTTTITVTGTQSLAEAQGIFAISPNIISVTPLFGTVGSQVTVRGNGFVATEDISLKFGVFPWIVTGSATDTGSFTVGFTVNTQGYEVTGITVYGVDINRNAATSTYQIMPRIIEFTPITGTVGCLVTISGNGYGADSTVRIILGTTARKDTAASPYGSFTTTFTIDTQPYAATVVTATGTTYSESGTKSFSILPAIWQVAPFGGSVGATISIRGNGYGASAGVNVWFGSTPGSRSTTNTDATGSFTTSFTIDTQVYGTTSLLAKGVGGELATNTVKILSNITSVVLGAGTVGSIVDVTGNGYVAGETIHVDFGTDPKVLTTSGNEGSAVPADGSFARNFVVSTQPYGATTVRAFVEDSYYTTITEATSTFSILPNIISILPLSGTVGSSVTVAGNGYSATQTVSIDFGDKLEIGSGSSVAEGSFTVLFSVDLQSYGTRTITARYGSQSDAKPLFTIIPNIRLVTPSAGTVGSQVSVEGDGYG